jgi:hypothetical protein
MLLCLEAVLRYWMLQTLGESFSGNGCVATEFESLQDRSFISLLEEPQDLYHV